jgi:phosphoribosylaminoimidazolecarboxamide formyltransferase/IMP cyclohydrolase
VKALLSVYDKSGIAEFASKLVAANFGLISTGGTFATLSAEGLPVKQVSEVTGSPEILDGRVKTLHPVIHGGLLGRRDVQSHIDEMASHGIDPIDVVVVNLYPFVETIAQADVPLDVALENIDIGGPTMLRAAAKNFPSVIVVVDPSDYGWISEKLGQQGLTLDERRKLAAKAFAHVAVYDSAVTNYLTVLSSDEEMPEALPLGLNKILGLRYGENPHQRGALYSVAGVDTAGIAGSEQLHGRELSFNNLMDADAAWRTVSDFDEPTAVVIKHTNACGLASDSDLVLAYQKAYEGDSVSAFGGIVGYNRPVTAAVAEAMESVFYEVVVAPSYDDDALAILTKKRNLRILAINPESVPANAVYDVRPITGGVLVQTPDVIEEDPASWEVVTDRPPTAAELKDMAFAWKAGKHIKSNAIVLAKNQSLMGMGAGQPNRVVSVHLSQRVAGDKALGSVLASDAFFPFPDNIELAANAGVTAIVQPGGSIRDEEVIAAANQHNLAMVFTGVRHFKH